MESIPHFNCQGLSTHLRSGLSPPWDSKTFMVSSPPSLCGVSLLDRWAPVSTMPTLSPVSQASQGFSLHPHTCAHRKHIMLFCSYNFLHKRQYLTRTLFQLAFGMQWGTVKIFGVRIFKHRWNWLVLCNHHTHNSPRMILT